MIEPRYDIPLLAKILRDPGKAAKAEVLQLVHDMIDLRTAYAECREAYHTAQAENNRLVRENVFLINQHITGPDE